MNYFVVYLHIHVHCDVGEKCNPFSITHWAVDSIMAHYIRTHLLMSLSSTK